MRRVAAIALAAALGLTAPRTAGGPQQTSDGAMGAPSDERTADQVDLRSGPPLSLPTPRATREASHTVTHAPGGRAVQGVASWGYFAGHVVTRLARGTLIRVCGPLGCTGWVRSWGHGPALWTGRLVDLDRGIFAAICGDTRQGLCAVTLWRAG